MKVLDKQILAFLRSGTDITQKELATTLNAKAGAIAQALTRLQKAGFIDLKKCGLHTMPRLRVLVLIEELLEAQQSLKAAT